MIKSAKMQENLAAQNYHGLHIISRNLHLLKEQTASTSKQKYRTLFVVTQEFLMLKGIITFS